MVLDRRMTTAGVGGRSVAVSGDILEFDHRLDRIPAEVLLSAVVPGSWRVAAMLRDYGRSTLATLSHRDDYARTDVLPKARPTRSGAAPVSSVARRRLVSLERSPLRVMMLCRPRYAAARRIVREQRSTREHRSTQQSTRLPWLPLHTRESCHEDALIARTTGRWKSSLRITVLIDIEVGRCSQAPVGQARCAASARVARSSIWRSATHSVMVEAMKLALADREVWYGDPASSIADARLLDALQRARRSSLREASANCDPCAVDRAGCPHYDT